MVVIYELKSQSSFPSSKRLLFTQIPNNKWNWLLQLAW